MVILGISGNKDRDNDGTDRDGGLVTNAGETNKHRDTQLVGWVGWSVRPAGEGNLCKWTGPTQPKH